MQIINSDSLISANVPDGVKKLTISSCYNLTDLNNIDELDYISLAKVGISEIFVPKTCTYFRCNSESLTKATFEEGRTCITEFMFSGCRNLEQVIIPDGISSIEKYAFDQCTKLKTVYIPASIKQIDRFSFGDSNNLEKVYYSGTHDQWYSITIMNEDEIINDSIDDIFYKADIDFGVVNLITKEPEDYTGYLGSTATFTVEAEGEDLQYQWQVFKNNTWANCSVKDGAKTDTLSLEAKESRNGSNYHCVITDKNGNTVTSNKATLNVVTLLKIETQPEDFTAAAGEMATFTVAAQGSGLKYQWQTFKNGSWTNCSINDGARTDTLSLEAKESRNGSKYQCVITDKNGETVTTNEVKLTVATPLIIETQPEDVSGAAGEMATFTVVAEGSGLKYQWQTLKNGAWTNCSVNDGAKTDTLSLEIKSSRDGSIYHCVITDKNGASVTTEDVTLSMLKGVKIKTNPLDYYGKVNTMATFTVVAEGEGLKYQWQVLKDGVWTNCSVNDGAKTNTLTLEIKNSRNGCEYHCVVTDKYGNTAISSSASIIVDKTIDLPFVPATALDSTEPVAPAATYDSDEVDEYENVVDEEVIDIVTEIQTETVTEVD
ncbi:MAG: leucine-rich repeat domain-containing protein [Clostridiales bacterium]|nr:leucine-rich repeat domain-containing protein [Clostridiales bacterium]